MRPYFFTEFDCVFTTIYCAFSGNHKNECLLHATFHGKHRNEPKHRNRMWKLKFVQPFEWNPAHKHYLFVSIETSTRFANTHRICARENRIETRNEENKTRFSAFIHSSRRFYCWFFSLFYFSFNSILESFHFHFENYCILYVSLSLLRSTRTIDTHKTVNHRETLELLSDYSIRFICVFFLLFCFTYFWIQSKKRYNFFSLRKTIYNCAQRRQCGSKVNETWRKRVSTLKMADTHRVIRKYEIRSLSFYFTQRKMWLL